jgi:hypothetical protein
LSRITALRIEVLPFKQKEKETLGAAWARLISLINSGPNVFLPNHALLHHFHLGLSKEAALHLDISLGGSFSHKTISEEEAILEKILENTQDILEKILKNTSYTSVFDEFPKEEVEPSLDQQEEAQAIESKIPLNSSDNLVAK